jgi:hypothetical protein
VKRGLLLLVSLGIAVASAKDPVVVSYSGGNGSTLAKAVIIKAPDGSAGVPAEYTYIQMHFGKYETIRQGLSEEKKRWYDIITFSTLITKSTPSTSTSPTSTKRT